MPMQTYPMQPGTTPGMAPIPHMPMKGKPNCETCKGTGMKFSKKKEKMKECKCTKKKK